MLEQTRPTQSTTLAADFGRLPDNPGRTQIETPTTDPPAFSQAVRVRSATARPKVTEGMLALVLTCEGGGVEGREVDARAEEAALTRQQHHAHGPIIGLGDIWTWQRWPRRERPTPRMFIVGSHIISHCNVGL